MTPFSLLWSAATCRCFLRRDDMSSRQHRVQRCDAGQNARNHDNLPPDNEPLNGALPERKVARVAKAQPCLRTPK